jgi:hypothetical protein
MSEGHNIADGGVELIGRPACVRSRRRSRPLRGPSTKRRRLLSTREGRTRRRGGCLAPREPSRQLGGRPLAARGERRAGGGSDDRRRDRHTRQQRDLDHGGGRGAALVLAARRRTAVLRDCAILASPRQSHPRARRGPLAEPAHPGAAGRRGHQLRRSFGQRSTPARQPGAVSEVGRRAAQPGASGARPGAPSGTQGGPAGPVARRRTAAVWRARHRRRGQAQPRVRVAPAPGAGPRGVDRPRPPRSGAIGRRRGAAAPLGAELRRVQDQQRHRLSRAVGAARHSRAHRQRRRPRARRAHRLVRRRAARTRGRTGVSHRVLRRPDRPRQRAAPAPRRRRRQRRAPAPVRPGRLDPHRTRRRPDLCRGFPGRRRLPDRQRSHAAEGEALLGWMSEAEGRWRADMLDEFTPIAETT